MIELRVQPRIERVTTLAGRREFSIGMIRIGGVLKILQVAGRALCREPQVLPRCGPFVATFARHSRVRSK